MVISKITLETFVGFLPDVLFIQKVFLIFNASFKKRVFLFPQYKDCQKSNQDSEWRKLLLCSIQIIKQNRFILVLCYFPVHYYFFLIRSDSGN